MTTGGSLIAHARADRKLTLAKLSELTGIHENQISRFENNRRLPSFEQLIVLAFNLDVSLSYLIPYGHPYREIYLKLERVI